MELNRTLKTTVRWLLWGLAGLGIIAIGLVIADSLHGKTCRDQALEGRIVEIPGVREPEGDPHYRLRPEDGHVHPHQEERFEVVKGRARFLVADREVVLAPGEIGVVPPNTAHHWMALDGQPVQVKASFTRPWTLASGSRLFMAIFSEAR